MYQGHWQLKHTHICEKACSHFSKLMFASFFPFQDIFNILKFNSTNKDSIEPFTSTTRMRTMGWCRGRWGFHPFQPCQSTAINATVTAKQPTILQSPERNTILCYVKSYSCCISALFQLPLNPGIKRYYQFPLYENRGGIT
jgi:hypothetical protein